MFSPCFVRTGSEWTYWDSRVSPNDIEELWRDPDVLKEWTNTAEIQGKVRFSLDKEKDNLRWAHRGKKKEKKKNGAKNSRKGGGQGSTPV